MYNGDTVFFKDQRFSTCRMIVLSLSDGNATCLYSLDDELLDIKVPVAALTTAKQAQEGVGGTKQMKTLAEGEYAVIEGNVVEQGVAFIVKAVNDVEAIAKAVEKKFPIENGLAVYKWDGTHTTYTSDDIRSLLDI